MTLARYDAAAGPLDKRLAELREARAGLDGPGSAPRADAGEDWARRWQVALPAERRELLRLALRGRRLVVGPAELVSASRAGKGSAERPSEELLPVEIETAQVGSGEGIAHLLATRTRAGVERTADAVLMQVTEIDTLGALHARQGSTLLPELRKAYMGEALGFSYADKARRLPIAAHSYRLCLTAGIQEARGRVLLGDADGGTPQRFIWLPAADPDAPDVAPPAPPALKWRGLHPGLDMLDHPVEMPVSDTARETIDAARLSRLRGNGAGLDAHALLTREKVAAALALLAAGPR